MGLFDEIRCKADLPVDLDVDHRSHWFQTKSLLCAMDMYEIREDGTLWRERYDIEDKSDPEAIGIEAMVGCMTRTNKEWVACDLFTGEIRFHTLASSIERSDIGQIHSGWIKFSSYFICGRMVQIELLTFTSPQLSSEPQEESNGDRS